MTNSTARRFRRFAPEFAAADAERAYRSWNLPDTVSHARIALVVGTVLAPFPIINDYMLFGLGTPFSGMFALRMLSWTFGLWLVFALRKPRGVSTGDTLLLVWMAGVIVVSATASSLRPPGFMTHVLVHQSILFAAYIFVPLRYAHRVACGLAGAALYLALQWMAHAPPAGTLAPLVIAMVFVNMIGAATSFQLERLRRMEYVRLEDLRAANRKLEEEQQALRQAKQHAETANLAKSRFLAAASHDLRQPVHALGMFVGALRARKMDDESARLVQHIDDSVSAMDGLFGSLLDISRLDAGVIRPRVESIAIGPLLERICTEYAEEARGKGVRLVLRRTAAAVTSDPVLLERIVRNLVSNAVRYCNSGGVLVGCRRTRATSENRKHAMGSVRIQVWDTGIGIAPEHRENIFQEFYQVENPERDRAKGLGLGLAIVERLTALLGHSLVLRSHPGKGSLFEVSVPAAEACPSKPARDVSRRIEYSSGLVLVVDDEVAIQDAMRRLLKSWGLANITAGSCDEMLELIADCPSMPDLIVCDYRLRAGERGTSVIQRLQAEYNEEIPGILITGDTAPDCLKDAQESGFVLLHKPVSNGRLRAAIDGALRSKPVRMREV